MKCHGNVTLFVEFEAENLEHASIVLAAAVQVDRARLEASSSLHDPIVHGKDVEVHAAPERVPELAELLPDPVPGLGELVELVTDVLQERFGARAPSPTAPGTAEPRCSCGASDTQPGGHHLRWCPRYTEAQ